METLDSNVILEKNKLAGEAPWLLLLEVQLTTAETVYLVRNTENITFNSTTYIAFPFEIDERKMVSKGEIPTLGIRVGNPERLLQSYIEDYGGLVGNNITVRIVTRYNDTGSWTQAVAYTYQVLSCEADSMYVTFTLGAPNPLNKRFPLYKYVPNHCNWQFGGKECNFTWTAVGRYVTGRVYWPGDLVYPSSGAWSAGLRDYTWRCVNAGKSVAEPAWATATNVRLSDGVGSGIVWGECSLTTWTASYHYYEGDFVHPTASTKSQDVYRCITEGVSGASQPNPWPTVTILGAQVTDGTVTWEVGICKRTIGMCRDLMNSDNYGGHAGLSGKGMKVVDN
jgi:phage-related protein